MNLRHLRRIRIVISVLFFLAVTLLFLNVGRRVPQGVGAFLLSLQFVPALLKLFTAVGISAIGLAFIVVSTLLFGRLYCSSMCPLGTLQDAIILFPTGSKEDGASDIRGTTMDFITQHSHSLFCLAPGEVLSLSISWIRSAISGGLLQISFALLKYL